jgi:NAD(P)-dependent dehydrogenase (short-subunit alcohol dehydrogenase family)/3-hydroxymyristoyl/3-hydroxydecanoyl-(acyl carrier protein) dehydratase
MQDETLKPLQDDASLKRLVFRNIPVELSVSAPIKLSRYETVLLLSPDRNEKFTKNVGDILRQDCGVNTIPMSFMNVNGTAEEGHDIFTDEGSSKVSAKISGLSSLAGMVITLPEGWSVKLRGLGDVSRLLRGLFLQLQTFLRSPARKFFMLIHSEEDSETPGRLLAEGMLGLFLSAAQEYPSVQFRTLEIGRDTDIRFALRCALDRGYTVVETIHRDGKVFTSEGHVAPSVFGDSSGLPLNPGDVIVMSGGGAGISAHLGRCLVPFGPRLILLGRTPLDQGIHPAKQCPEHPASGASPFDPRASEIVQTLADLNSSGIEATYYKCDVTDPEAVRAVVNEVAGRHGRIDGIIHGAGVLRDGLLSHMAHDDFSMVTDVKFLGAWNLFSAAETASLRFFVGLSSAAAIQGNPGQANYAAANRMMSALLRYLHSKNGDIRFKALMLPPVEGTGMADDPGVRELLKRKGVEYIHVNELAGLFCRELFVAPPEDDWVMFMRRLPSVSTVLINDISNINDTSRFSFRGELDGGTVSFSQENFPMIEEISFLDIRREELEASRTFSLEKDLWIADHKPFKFVRHPLVSACMVLETFMEAARILFPHLQARGVRQVRLMEMIQCPPGVPRLSRISCRRAGKGIRELLCDVSLSTQDLSPAGRLTDRFTTHCDAQVILDGGGGNLAAAFPDFPIRPEELRTGPMDHKEVLNWYKDRSGFKGRYRVIESLEGAGPGVVRGRTTCVETNDFANLKNARYQYSPYILEAILQLVGFHIAIVYPSERRSIIPVEIGEMRFLRKCRAGERITIEARMRAQDDAGLSWDARGIDEQGRAIMQVYGIGMHWVSD